MEAFFIIFGPTLGVVLSIVIPVFIGWVAIQYHRLTGVQMSAEHRDALHSAINTGINAALNRGITGKAATSFAIEYAITKGAPDAVKYLQPGSALREIAESKLDAALAKAIGK